MLAALFINDELIAYALDGLRACFAHNLSARLPRRKPAVFKHGYFEQLACFQRVIYFGYHFGPYFPLAYLKNWLQSISHSSERRSLLSCYHSILLKKYIPGLDKLRQASGRITSLFQSPYST